MKESMIIDAKNVMTGVNMNLEPPVVTNILNNDMNKPINKKITKHNILIKVGFKNSLRFIRIEILDKYIKFCK